MIDRNYSATLTGNPFLLFETRQVALLMKDTNDPKVAMNKIIESNLFQYSSTKSVPKRFNAIHKRISVLDKSLVDCLASGSVNEAKITNLLAIASSDRLFKEFVVETIACRLTSHKQQLTLKDIEDFFEYKQETIREVKGWTEKTIKKLIQVYVQILYQSGLINDRKSKTLQKLFISVDFKGKLLLSFNKELIECIAG